MAAKKVNILGVMVSSESHIRVLTRLTNKLSNEGGEGLEVVFTPNPEQVVMANEDDRFCDILSKSSINIPDGVGLVWASRWKSGEKGKWFFENWLFGKRSNGDGKSLKNMENRGQVDVGRQGDNRSQPLNPRGMYRDVRANPNFYLRERIAGVELAEELVEFCVENGLKAMLVGGEKGVARAASAEIQKSNLPPLLKLPTTFKLRGTGRRAGKNQKRNSKFTTFGKDEDRESRVTSHESRTMQGDFWIKGIQGLENVASATNKEKKKLLEEIEKFRPALVLVGFGAPKQEEWVVENRVFLEKVGVRVVMVVGGALDVWAGKVKRAPRVVRFLGLEWLWRLVQEPWRWRRQLRLLKFVRLVISS